MDEQTLRKPTTAMSTIASPRLSSLQSPTHSSRSSLSLDRSAPHQRRNRTALRDYYSLKSTADFEPPPTLQSAQLGDTENKSELDQPGFDAETYVAGVLSREGLEGVLGIESGLVSDIRGLDGEGKALVYDNYSKLIAATDTIRKMRTNMDPLAPITSTLAPAISQIAEIAVGLSASLRKRMDDTVELAGQTQMDDDKEVEQKKQRDTVQWVLGAPTRIAELAQNGKNREAADDWAEVTRLLDQWAGTKGVEELRKQGNKALKLTDNHARNLNTSN